MFGYLKMKFLGWNILMKGRKIEILNRFAVDFKSYLKIMYCICREKIFCLKYIFYIYVDKIKGILFFVE